MFQNKPNIPDYEKFLFNVAGIPVSALSASIADPTVAPTLSVTPGGVLIAATYSVAYTYTNPNGETLASPVATLAVDPDNLLVVAAPVAAPGATAWNVYVGATTVNGSQAATLQAAGLPFGPVWTEPVDGLVMGLPLPTANTSEAPIIATSLAIAEDIVNITLAQASSNIYVLAVYNLATDRLINYAIDLTGQNYFTNLRTEWNLTAPVVGVATSGSDQSTSSAWLNPDQLKTLTLADLQTLKTPYGRSYLGFAQSYGTLWGLT